MIVFTNNSNLYMDINKLKILLEITVTFVVYFFLSSFFNQSIILLIGVSVIGWSRWRYTYSLKSWVVFVEVMSIILFIGSLEKVIFNSSSSVDDPIYKELLFWFLAINKLIVIKPLRDNLRRMI